VRRRSALVVLLAALVAASAAAGGRQTPAAALRGIPLGEYAARRTAAIAQLDDGIVVVRGAVEEELGENWRFRQNNWFMYLTGADVPGAVLLLNPFAQGGERETLYLPARDPNQERWTGPKIGPGADAQRQFGLATRDLEYLDDDIRAIADRLVRAKRRVVVYTIAPSGPDAKYSRDGAFADVVRGLVPAGTTIGDAREALSELRRTKSQAELDVLGRAIEITEDAQREVARTIAPGRFEYEVEAAILGTFVRSGAPRPGFPSIVGSGVYSTILHYAENTKQIEAGDLVVVDIGAEYHYYTADVTRTWPATGRFTARQREVYQLVLDAQEAAARAYKPGMAIRDLHAIAAATMRRSPLRDSKGQTLDTGFIHGLSHFLGMDVHDVGDVSRPLAPGDVITIEPGIYLADERLGVRIEDDYLVTENGLVKLSKGLPSTPDEIERMMGR
jgi:Xaa-Pro aminopeptidase